MIVLWQRQFGSTGRFALRLGLTEDPFHEFEGTARAASWGTLEIWVEGRCLTAAHHRGLGETRAVEWYLLEFLRWGVEHWGPLFHEGRFPSVLERVPDAASWASASLEPPLGLLDDEEEEWYQRRLEWWERHALRAASDGGSFPNLFFRRLQNEVEVSWDNETFPPCHPGVDFAASRGRALLPVEEVAGPFAEGLRGLAEALHERLDDEQTRSLLERAKALGLGFDTARGLFLPPSLSALLRARRPSTRSSRAPGGGSRRAWHRFDAPTLLFSSSSPELAPGDAEALLALARDCEQGPWRLPVQPERRPAPPSEPYREGYELALALREELGWGAEPLPPLERLLAGWGIALRRLALENPSIHGLALHVPGCVPVIGLNTRSPRVGRHWSENMLLAHELCHLLYDAGADGLTASLSSPWAEWPSEARANAFAAMLLMPDDGLRALLGRGRVDAEKLRAVMRRFGVGALAATWHLQNRGFIAEPRRLALLHELGLRSEFDFAALGA